jgi:hypothetical protein
MPLPLTTEARAALRNHRIEPAFLLDLFTDTTSLHCSSLYIPLTYDVGDGVERAYEAMGDRWDHGDDAITMGTDINPEPLNLRFDASRQSDNSDFVGRFADSSWHRRRSRLTMIVFAVGSHFAIPIAPIISWEGEMDFRDFPEVDGAPPTMVLTMESGTFRYLGRNAQTRTDENQQRFFPGDVFFQDLPGLIGRELPWHRAWVTNAASGGVAPSAGGIVTRFGRRY